MSYVMFTTPRADRSGEKASAKRGLCCKTLLQRKSQLSNERRSVQCLRTQGGYVNLDQFIQRSSYSSLHEWLHIDRRNDLRGTLGTELKDQS
jgi:hypothetical protein